MGTCLLAAAVSSSVGLTPLNSAAQDFSGDLQRQHPTPAPLGGLSQNSGEILPHLGWAVGLHANYSEATLIARQSGLRVASFVRTNLTLHAHAAIGLFGVAELGLAHPFVISQSSEIPETLAVPAPAPAGIGDLRIEPRVRLLTQTLHGVALSLAPVLTLPTGSQAALASDGSIGFRPVLDLSWRAPRVQLMLSAGVHLRSAGFVMLTNSSRQVITGSELVGRAGIVIYATRHFSILAEATGTSPLESASDQAVSARRQGLDATGGVRFAETDKWAMDFGVTLPLLTTPGVADIRFVGGLTVGSQLSAPSP